MKYKVLPTKDACEADDVEDQRFHIFRSVFVAIHINMDTTQTQLTTAA